ncbi:GAF domain-containing protein [Nocardia sp. NPDC049149]|uniref:GAF domain-containing protein n=1 Tax=Nocardia sp. NPDC049149 TaxID=3364315 RepID=UPI00371AB262
MLGEWLLIECVRKDPNVMAIGRKPVRLQPLQKVLRNETLKATRRLTNQVRRSGHRWEETSTARGEHLIAEPITNTTDRIYGIRIWVGHTGIEVPLPPRSGAWDLNLDTMVALYTDETHDVYQVPKDRRRTEISRMSALRYLNFAEDEGAAFALAMRADDTTLYQNTWPIIRGDGVARDLHFCARGARVGGRRFLQGLAIDISPGRDEPAEPPPLTFSQAVMAAELSVPGIYHALVDLKTLIAHRWLGAEMPGIAWELTGDADRDPALHPEDIALARATARATIDGPSNAVLRLRNTQGGWTRVRVEAKRVLLTRDSDAVAILVSMAHDTATE